MQSNKLGIFIGFAPGQDIKDQGIGRLLGFILRGMLENNEEILIACPLWYVDILENFLADQNLITENIKVLTNENLSLFQKWLANLLRKKVNREKTQTRCSLIFHLLKKIKHNFLVNKLYNIYKKKYLIDLCNIINAQSNACSWYIPAPFWIEIQYIKHRKIIAIPDVVMLEYPHYFDSYHWKQVLEVIKLNAKFADKIVCYTSYVRDYHIINYLNVDPNKVAIVKHGYIDSAFYISNRSMARSTVIEELNKYFSLKNIKFDNLLDKKVLLYASQIRPYKNFENLFHAISILRKSFLVKIVLIITGDIVNDINYLNLIHNLDISDAVLSMPNLPSHILTYLNIIADLAVNPTNFEGGFPFTFTEAFSVGTPSILSTIPMVTEQIKGMKLEGIMLMDQNDPNAMAQKIDWALKNLQLLYYEEKKLFDAMIGRSWKIAALEYIKLMKNEI